MSAIIVTEFSVVSHMSNSTLVCHTPHPYNHVRSVHIELKFFKYLYLWKLDSLNCREPLGMLRQLLEVGS
jgi:hypothetical protein